VVSQVLLVHPLLKLSLQLELPEVAQLSLHEKL
jgi:hypothetical protein